MNLQNMKNKIAHVCAGFSVGLIVYALYLFGLSFFGVGLHRTAYWLMPISPQSNLYSSFLTNLTFIWQYNRIGALAVLFGLSAPLFFSIVAWWLAGKRPLLWLRRWYAQVVFAGAGLAAFLFIVNIVTVILPL